MKFFDTGGSSFPTAKKALLMKAGTDLLLMSPMDVGEPLHVRGLHQLDIGAENIVSRWGFEKHGASITMTDI